MGWVLGIFLTDSDDYFLLFLLFFELFLIDLGLFYIIYSSSDYYS